MQPSMAAQVLIEDGHRVRQSFEDENGDFDLEAMQKFVRHFLQLTEEKFVEEQRKELVAERMRKLLVAGITVSISRSGMAVSFVSGMEAERARRGPIPRGRIGRPAYCTSCTRTML